MKILIGQYEASIYAEGDGYTGAVSLGHDGAGKRNRLKRKGRTKTAVKAKLKSAIEDLEAGISTDDSYTVRQCIEDWLAQGLKGKSDDTKSTYTSLSRRIIAELGAAKLKELKSDDVDKFLDKLSSDQATSTLSRVHNVLTRAIRHAERRDKVGRNVSALCDNPTGKAGRPSKAMTMKQAVTVIEEAKDSKWRLGVYVILCLATGLRTEEARVITWKDVDLKKGVIYVLRADREGGDTKTTKSRRGLGMAKWATEALAGHKARQAAERLAAGKAWQKKNLVFCREDGSQLASWTVRRESKKITEAAGMGTDWTPRETRHSFVSILSDQDVSIEKIADLCGHASSVTTAKVYRKQLKPVITEGAQVMNKIIKKSKSA